MASASTSSSFLRPAFSGPKRKPRRAPCRAASRIAAIAARGASTGFSISLRPRGGGVDQGEVGHGLGHGGVDAGPPQHRIGARGRAQRLDVGPAVAGLDQAQVGEPAVEHGAGGGADVLAELGADENDRRRRLASTWAAARLLRRSVPATAQPAAVRGARRLIARGATDVPSAVSSRAMPSAAIAVADAVGLGEVALGTGRGAGRDQRLDLGLAQPAVLARPPRSQALRPGLQQPEQGAGAAQGGAAPSPSPPSGRPPG